MTTEVVIDLKASRNALVAGSVGNLIEWYEFAIYGYMAPYIAKQFFPSDAPLTGILATFLVFAVAFFTRPLGALIFGRMADRIGRRPTLVSIIVIMTVFTAIIGLLPSANAIGNWATLLLVICRIAQGLSGGGEMGGAVSLIVENAPHGRRGIYGSWSFISTVLGFVVGGTVTTVITSSLPHNDMLAWGWRIPFLLAIPFGIVALYIRTTVDETPHFKRINVDADLKQIKDSGQKNIYTPLYLLVTVGILVVYNAAGNIFMVAMPTYLSSAFKMPPVQAFLLTLVTGLISAISMPFFAALSDRIGRGPVLFAGAIGSTFLSYPLYMLMGQGLTGGLAALCIAGLLIGAAGGPLPAFLSERFPTRHRGTGVALAYSVSIAIFGGLAPYAITLILKLTGNPYAAGYYTAICGAISMVALVIWRGEGKDVTNAHLEVLED